MTDKQKNSGRRGLYITLVIILGLIAAGIIGWNLYKYKFIKGKVSTAVYEKTNGLYTIHYDKMELDEVGGYLHVTNLKIVPDTAKFRQMVLDKSNPGLLLAIEVPELKISGVKTPEAMLGKKLNGRKLEIDNATVVFYYAKAHPDSSQGAVKGAIYQQLLGSLKEIQADSVTISNISLTFIDIRNNRKTIEASHISVQLRDVLIDSLHSNDADRFFFARHLQVDAQKAILKNRAGTYFYLFDNIQFNKDEEKLSVASMQIEPQLSEEKFAAFAKLQTDRFNITCKHISLRHIDLARLMQADVIADSLLIQEGIVKVFRDRNYPSDKLSRVGQYPQQLLLRMPINVSIKKMLVGNAFIEYKEKNPKSDFNGRVQFVHANAVISNISNEEARIQKDNHCRVSFNARFLDIAPAHVNLDLLLGDRNGKFMYNGTVEGFDAGKLNVLIQPMGLAQVEKGTVNKLNFSFTGQNNRSDGTVVLLYNDLKLTLLKKDSSEDALKKKKLASFVANIIIKNANPLRKKPVRVANVHFMRDTSRSFFNLMWKSLYAGIKQTAGM